MRLAKKEASKRGKAELEHKAKMCVSHRRRLEASNTKATNTMFLLRQQIDSIVSTHSDTLVIDAMRQYSMVASRLGLPDRAAEVQVLNEDLSEHQAELRELEQALKTGLSMNTVQEEEDEDDLRTELDHLLLDEEPATTNGLVQRRSVESSFELPKAPNMPIALETKRPHLVPLVSLDGGGKEMKA